MSLGMALLSMLNEGEDMDPHRCYCNLTPLSAEQSDQRPDLIQPAQEALPGPQAPPHLL